MTLPIIGICAAYETATWSFWKQPAAIVSSTYINKIRDAGGLSIGLIPHPSALTDPWPILRSIDGLLLIGGADLEPSSYGQHRTERTEATAPDRDAFELALARAALQADLPVLGICRGLQILNVAAGGTLHQHLLDEGYAEHRPSPGRLDSHTFHDVEVDPDSLAAHMTGAGVSRVNSHHHQGVSMIGRGAVVTARSLPDGLPEALEWPESRYALGVQWHPEAEELEHALNEFVDVAANARLNRTDQSA